MPGDAVLTRDGPVSVPLSYVVPQGGELLPLTVRATIDGASAASSFYAVVQVVSPSGVIMGNYRTAAIAAGGSADCTWFPGAELDETPGQLPIAETLLLPSWASSVSSANVLPAGIPCLITVQGTYTDWNEALNTGVPESGAQFPSTPSGVTRVSTQVGIDADTLFAYPSSHPQTIGHWTQFQINTGSGYSHVEPVGGPYTTPQTGHSYTYHVVGQGQVAQFRINDTPLNDNYGALQILISGTPASPSGLAVTDGVTTVANTGEIDFTSGATVTDGGGGIAQVAISGGGGGVDSVTAADTSIVIAGTASNPTVKTGTLDVVATQHPPAANWSNNSRKITSVTDPTSAQDAATKNYVDTSSPVTSVFARTGAVVAGNADYLAVASGGLTGATQATRYVGATASAAPVSGTFAVGDFVVVQSGHILVCTSAGTPGTWTDVGSVSNLVTSVFGRAGAVTATSGDYTLNQIGNATGDYSINSHKLTSVTDPTSAQDAATKNYVDTHAVSGGAWDTIAITTSDHSTTNSTATDIPELSITLSANHTYELEFLLLATASTTAGNKYAMNFTGTLTNGEWVCNGSTSQVGALVGAGTMAGTLFGTALITSAAAGVVLGSGFITVGGSGGDLRCQQAKQTSGTATCLTASQLKTRQIA